VEFKQTFETEKYVKYCLSRRRRSLIAQIRIGILPLHIETGRFRNLKVEERTCQICKQNEIENEFHFICICNIYTHFRNEMYNKINNTDFVDMSDKDKFIYLMKNNWKEVSQYMELAWNKRTDIMYKNT
jgi:hypothetical protein